MNTEVIDPALGGRAEIPAGETVRESGQETAPGTNGTEVAAAAVEAPEEPAAATEGTVASVDIAPVEEPLSAEASTSAEEPVAAEEPASAEETMPAEETESLPTEENMPAEEPAPAEKPASEQAATETPAPVDYSGYSRPSLVTILEDLVEHQDADAIRHDVDAIKVQFYRKLRQ